MKKKSIYEEICEDDGSAPIGFSDIKDSKNYWMDAVRDFWQETKLDTDCCDLDTIIKWFDKRRNINLLKESK